MSVCMYMYIYWEWDGGLSCQIEVIEQKYWTASFKVGLNLTWYEAFLLNTEEFLLNKFCVNGYSSILTVKVHRTFFFYNLQKVRSAKWTGTFTLHK